MGAEEATMQIGMMGKWQLLTYSMLCILSQMPTVWQAASIVFIGYTYHTYTCVPKPGLWKNQSIPMEDGAYSSCERYKYNISYSNETENCDQYDFVPDMFDVNNGTITIEWNLVCDKRAWVDYSQMLLSAGVAVGCAFFTPFADWFGRKKVDLFFMVFFFCQLVLIIFATSMSFCTDYSTWCFMQFITGLLTTGNDVAGFVLANELFTADMRIFTASVIILFYNIGGLLLVLMAYYIRSWRDLQFTFSVLPVLTFVYMYWCPESLRWLEINGRYEEAQEILDQAAKMNGCPPVPPEVIKKKSKSVLDGNVKPSFFKFLSYKKTALYFLILGVAMFCTNLSWSAMGLLTQALAGDLYVNVAINMALEFPGVLMAIFAMQIWGRRKPVCVFLVLAGTLFALAAILDSVRIESISEYNQGMLVTAFALCSKFGTMGAWSIELVYVQEIFPTYLRTRGAGTAAGFGLIGSILGPLFLGLARDYTLGLPVAIMSGLCFFGGFAMLYQPETLGRVLPTTIEEILSWPRSLTPDEWEDVRRRRAELWQKIKDGWHGKPTPDANGKVEKNPVVNGGLSNPAFTPEKQESCQIQDHSVQDPDSMEYFDITKL